MSKVLIERNGRRAMRRQKTCSGRDGFALNKNGGSAAGKIKISLVLVFASAIAVGFLGVIYLYQANSIATKSYEVRQIESGLLDLQKESQKLKIKEMELRSMNNIEKSVEELDLVSSSGIIYTELSGPIAMR